MEISLTEMEQALLDIFRKNRQVGFGLQQNVAGSVAHYKVHPPPGDELTLEDNPNLDFTLEVHLSFE